MHKFIMRRLGIIMRRNKAELEIIEGLKKLGLSAKQMDEIVILVKNALDNITS